MMTEEIKTESNERCEVIVKVGGSVRTAKVTLEQYNKHEGVIKAWCNGKCVEVLASGHWNYLPYPDWAEYTIYRVEPEKPKQGEIWKDVDNKVYIYINSNFVCLSEGTVKFADTRFLNKVEFVADSFEDWLVKYEQSLSSTDDSPFAVVEYDREDL